MGGGRSDWDYLATVEPALRGIELVRVSLPLLRPWASGAVRMSHRDSLLVRTVLQCEVPGGGTHEVEGWGECAALASPTYSAEHTSGAIEVCRDHLVPRLFDASVGSAAALGAALRPVKGHNMAKAALEASLLDAELRAAGLSMAAHFAALSNAADGHRTAVPGGVAIALTQDVAELVDDVARWVEAGCHRVKLKIIPGHDRLAVRSVRERWPDLALCADANGSYAALPPGEALARVRALEPFGLTYLEQPLADDDLLGHAELARSCAVPICLDEALTSPDMIALALQIGACSVVNVKASRLGGYIEAVRAHDLCAHRGAHAWCGGMVETGIGRAANVALASLPNFDLPGDISGTGRFFDPDIAGPITVTPDGMVAVPEGPGIGVAVDVGAIGALSTWRLWCPAKG